MIFEASARKCARSGTSTRDVSASRMYASWTSAVVLSEFSDGAPRNRTCAIAIRRSYTSGMSRSRARSSPALHCRKSPVTSLDVDAIGPSSVQRRVHDRRSSGVRQAA